MNERLKTHSKTQKKSADLVSNKLRIGVFQRYQMKCKSVSKKSPRYTDQNDTPITPNDLNSVIPFRLDAAAAANVTLRAWPISITGQKPTEGPFSALGYLRVDYQ